MNLEQCDAINSGSGLEKASFGMKQKYFCAFSLIQLQSTCEAYLVIFLTGSWLNCYPGLEYGAQSDVTEDKARSERIN